MDSNTPSDRMFQIFLAVEGGLFLVALVLAWLFGLVLVWGVSLFATVVGICGGLIMVPLFFWTLRSRWRPLAEIRVILVRFLGESLREWSWTRLLILAAVAGLAEEALFRGVVQAGIGAQFGLWPGLLAASLLFGLCHFVSPLYFILATLVGLYFGWLYEWTGGLLAPVIAHGLYDFVVLGIMKVRVQRLGVDDVAAGGGKSSPGIVGEIK